MAVAGLHNVSPFGPFSSESQCRDSERNTPSTTRASSLLRMWRELEGDEVASPSYTQQRNAPNTGRTSIEQETDINRCSNISEDAANKKETNHLVTGSEDDDISATSEQSSDLGENERKRVRKIFREWKNSSALTGSSNGSSNFSGPQWRGENECERVREHKSSSDPRSPRSEVSETDSFRDGLVSNNHQESSLRRPIRKLCGRQALVDLLKRSQCERNGELELLSEQKPVSEFSHRNRIQALLRGRFLRNERSVEDKQQSSVAADELDFLRQRQTVSDLREEFLSKLDSNASASSIIAESDSSSSHENDTERKINPENNRTWDPHEDPVLRGTEENEQETTSSHTKDPPIAETEDRSHRSLEIEPLPESFPRREEQVSENEATEQQFSIDNVELAVDSIDSLVTTDEEDSYQQDSFLQHQTEALTDHISEGEEERNLTRNWHENFSNEWFQETSETNNDADLIYDDDDDDRVQESHEEEDWPSHDLQEAIDSWLLRPSSMDVGVSLGRFHRDYYPDDENAQSVEINELSSQRRVSSLLRSSFRDSLDRVLQSHVERQVRFSSTDSQGGSSSPSGEEQLIADQSLVTPSDNIETNRFDPTLTSITEQSPLWDGESLLPSNFNHLLGMEWEEVISELRIDVNRLQQRMNNMQRMMEACMDMQIELQRCVRQEVSAALNRTVSMQGDANDDESRWERVREGVCCLCGEGKINSLLYRCGHMCTCCVCAMRLLGDNGECPMCRAPVVEAVRAYFT